jgi:hypothetical protein
VGEGEDTGKHFWSELEGMGWSVRASAAESTAGPGSLGRTASAGKPWESQGSQVAAKPLSWPVIGALVEASKILAPEVHGVSR